MSQSAELEQPAARSESESRARSIWWLHPGKLTLLFTLPIYLFLVYVVPRVWPHLIVLRGQNYVDGQFALLGMLALLMLSGGALLGAKLDLKSRLIAPPYRMSESFLLGLGLITIAAYAIWFWPVVSRLQFFIPRGELNRMPGITSFTQFGVPFMSAYFYGAWYSHQRYSRSLRIMCWAIGFLTLSRVYIWSERLALIEIVLPIAVSALCYRSIPRRRLARGVQRVVVAAGPFLGILALLSFFSATEVVRSWTTYSTTTNQSFADFVVSRFTTYYYTALNNGAGLLQTSEWPTFEFTSTLPWLFRLPFGVGALFWSAIGRTEAPGDTFLRRFGDVEFNNMSGIFPIFYDLGTLYALIYFALLGALFGVLYRASTKAEGIGVMFFPPAFLASLEILRISYLGQPRSFLILVGALVVAVTQFRVRRAPS